jgi:two-component system, LuxR family, response regulator FixJ
VYVVEDRNSMGVHQKQPTIFIVDDDQSTTETISLILADLPSTVVGFKSCGDCLNTLRRGQGCNLLIADAHIPDPGGLDLMVEVKKVYPLLPVIIVAEIGTIPLAVKAIKMGAHDFLEKSVGKNVLISAVQAGLSIGLYASCSVSEPLTKSEITILKFVADGKSNSEIAYLLNRSIRTVEYHRYHLMHKLGVDSSAGLTKKAILLGLTTP